jgi:hypothetical protein
MDDKLWNEMLGVLKDISAFLDKEADSDMEKESLDSGDFDRPKTGESQAKKDPIKGGGDPSGKPGEDVIKAEDESEEDEKEEESEEEEKEEKDSDETMKSILKNLEAYLARDRAEIVKSVTAELKKSVPDMAKGMLRKMGYTPSRPDVMRIGADSYDDVRKSEDEKIEADLKKANKTVEDISRLSWRDLAKLREGVGDFNPFRK